MSIRKFLLDRDDTLFRLSSAAFDRMLRFPKTHRLPRFAGQPVRTAEVVVELMNGRPLAVVRSVFSMMTFKRDGTLVSPLRDPHVRARASSRSRSTHRTPARALPTPPADLSREVANGSRQLPSCGALSKLPWGASNAPESHPANPALNDSYVSSRPVAQNHCRPI